MRKFEVKFVGFTSEAIDYMTTPNEKWEEKQCEETRESIGLLTEGESVTIEHDGEKFMTSFENGDLYCPSHLKIDPNWDPQLKEIIKEYRKKDWKT